MNGAGTVLGLAVDTSMVVWRVAGAGVVVVVAWPIDADAVDGSGSDDVAVLDVDAILDPSLALSSTPRSISSSSVVDETPL